MKKITITNALSKDIKVRHSGLQDIVAEGMDQENDGQNYMEASDGYHTFTELYDHRITLFIALCKMKFLYYGQVIEQNIDDGDCKDIWRSKLHSDGSSFDGWFILGINQESGKQITYHLPLSRWEETNFARTLGKAPEWDGHTTNDVIERLKTL